MDKPYVFIVGAIAGGALVASIASFNCSDMVPIFNETVHEAAELDELSDMCSDLGRNAYMRTYQTIREKLNDSEWQITCYIMENRK